MRRIRIHVESALRPGTRVALPETAAQHLLRVLRMASGDPLVLFNGDGFDYAARLGSVARRGADAEVDAQLPPAAAEAPLRLTLGQALARGEKMDWVLQKATELGVAAIVPLLSERTEVRLDAERAARRMQHWRGVVVAACEQSGRAVVPVLVEPVALERFAADPSHPSPRLLLDPEADTGIAGLGADLSEATLAIGPEGGWSGRDIEILRAGGFGGLRLGPRVLRTETAGPVALAALQACYGDLR